MIDSRVGFLALLAALVVERLFELRRARRNEAALRRRGAIEAGRGHYGVMVALHAGWLLAAPLEVVLLDRAFHPVLGWAMVAAVALTQSLRYWVVSTLGERWTTRVLVLPGAPLIAAGPFRYLRHPNYLAVAVEVVALPLVHSAWLTAIGFGLANLALLAWRIRVEDAALGRRRGSAPAGDA